MLSIIEVIILNILLKIVKSPLRWPSAERLQDFGITYTLRHPKPLEELTEFNEWLQGLERILNPSISKTYNISILLNL